MPNIEPDSAANPRSRWSTPVTSFSTALQRQPPLFASGALQAGARKNADLLAVHGDDAGLAQLSQGSRGGLAIDAQMFRNLPVGQAADAVVLGALQQQLGQTRN